MELKVSHCFIAVHDHDEARRSTATSLVSRFATTSSTRHALGDGGPEGKARRQHRARAAAANPNASPHDKKVMSQLLADGMLRAVIFATDDCDATSEHVCRAGADVLQEAMDQGYGVRDSAFRDPSGNMVRFSQRR